MYNSDTPLRAELPSSKQLVRSTILAAISAVVLLVAVVLPAEYGIDPTGMGRMLGMTQMGEVKQQLAAEAAADAASTGIPPAAPAKAVEAAPAAPPEPATQPAARAAAAGQSQVAWRDEMPFTLSPGEGTEIKLKMVKDGQAQYAWSVEGGAVNYDTHGDAPGQSISYEKGRGVAADEGVLVAAFTGNHGWYWRNRGEANVKVVLRTRGDYTDIKHVK